VQHTATTINNDSKHSIYCKPEQLSLEDLSCTAITEKTTSIHNNFRKYVGEDGCSTRSETLFECFIYVRCAS